MPIDVLSCEPVEDLVHGVTVYDPYRWLEARQTTQTQKWIEEQQQRYEAYFSDLKLFDVLRQRVGQYLNVEICDQVTRIGHVYFHRTRKRDQEQPVLSVRNIVTGENRILIDPTIWGQFASVAIHRISDDGSLLAYELKHGGEDTKAIQIVDVKTGQILPDRIENGYMRGFAFSADRSGFYYCREAESLSSSHAIHFHHFGEAMNQDRPIFCVPRAAQSRLVLIADEIHLGAVFAREADQGIICDFYISCSDRNAHWKQVFASKAATYAPFLRNGRIFVVTDYGAPMSKIIEINEDGTQSRLVVPEWTNAIGNLALLGSDLYVSYMVDRCPVVRRWTLSGEYVGTIESPSDGSVGLLPSYSNSAATLFYAFESFTQPPAIFEYLPEKGKAIAWSKQEVPGSKHAYRIREVWYSSKDGTRIPMSLVMRQSLDDGYAHPAILTGYGGFGMSMTPRFSILVTVMLELGAVFALPNIRGGFEFGKDWHEAARGRKRQVAFDDFLAAADWLCSRQITGPDKLAIFGGSNSGLLVGVALTQRPELFRAVLCIAPMLDMVRYEQFGQARKFRHEYGTVSQPDDFAALYAYSPYHHISDDINYPAALFVSGDHDSRCDPAHVRKMAARLQNRAAQLNPILTDHSSNRGHSPTLPLSVRVEALTRRLAFLVQELGIPSLDGVMS